MAKMLMGAFKDWDKADRALRELESCGYTREEISVISTTNKFESRGYDTGSDVAKSAGTGAAAGGVIGGLAGLFAGVGIAPAIAGFFIGGPIAAAIGLVGAAATTATGALTGAAAGGLIGALTGAGLSRENAESYDRTVNDGGVVLGLTGHHDTTSEARRILEDNGASDINMIDMKDRSADGREESSDRRAGRQQPAFGERRDKTDQT